MSKSRDDLELLVRRAIYLPLDGAGNSKPAASCTHTNENKTATTPNPERRVDRCYSGCKQLEQLISVDVRSKMTPGSGGKELFPLWPGSKINANFGYFPGVLVEFLVQQLVDKCLGDELKPIHNTVEVAGNSFYKSFFGNVDKLPKPEVDNEAKELGQLLKNTLKVHAEIVKAAGTEALQLNMPGNIAQKINYRVYDEVKENLKTYYARGIRLPEVSVESIAEFKNQLKGYINCAAMLKVVVDILNNYKSKHPKMPAVKMLLDSLRVVVDPDAAYSTEQKAMILYGAIAKLNSDMSQKSSKLTLHGAQHFKPLLEKAMKSEVFQRLSSEVARQDASIQAVEAKKMSGSS